MSIHPGMTEKPHPLSVPLGTYDCRLIDLPKDYYKSIPKLVAHVKSVIADNERYHGRICEKFYIGKSFVRTWKGRTFDPHKPTTTWRKEGINNRWRARQEKGFDNMAVLAVFTNDSLPPLQSRRPALWKQQYTLALEQALITHFMFVENDQRLENKTTEPGRLEGGSAVGYVLYLAMKLREPKNPPILIPSLSTISWVNLTPPLALIYPHLKQFSQPLGYRSFTHPCFNQLACSPIPTNYYPQLRLTYHLNQVPTCSLFSQPLSRSGGAQDWERDCMYPPPPQVPLQLQPPVNQPFPYPTYM